MSSIQAFRLLIAIAGTASACCVCAKADVFQWSVAASGTWSASTNWQGLTVPPSGGAADAELRFGAGFPTPTTFVYNSTNDLGGVFGLNRFLFADNTRASITVRNASGSGLSFAGVNPRIDVTGLTNHTLSNQSGGLGLAVPGNVAVAMQSIGGSASNAALTISGPVSGLGGFTVSGVETAANLGVFQLQSATAANNNTFSGGVTLNSGNLYLDGANATVTPAGTGTLTINGGTLGFNSLSTRITGPMTVNADLRITRGTGTANGLITVTSPAAGLQIYGGALNLNVPAAFQGPTVLGDHATYAASTGPATLTLGSIAATTGPDGTLLSTPSIQLLDGASLIISNTTNTLADRVNDAAGVTMDSAYISLRSGSAGSTESVGAVSVAGYSVLEALPGSSTPFGAGSLTLASLTRADRGVVSVRGQNLGYSTSAPRSTIVVADGPPAMVGGGGADGTATISIVPWAVGVYTAATVNTSNPPSANSFATYGAGGFRALNPATEFASALGADPTQNVNLAASTNNDGPASVNALLLTAGTSTSITGSGSVAVTSGAVLCNAGGSDSTIWNSMSFDSAEAVITNTGPLRIVGPLSGSGGLTKSGNWPLVMYDPVGHTNPAVNSGLTGPLTINGSSHLDVRTDAGLPGTGPIVIHSVASTGAAGIGVSDDFNAANNPITIGRQIVIKSGMCALNTLTATTVAIFDNDISGDGSLIINASGSWGTIELTDSNTYTGITRINSGRLRIHSDENLGNGGPLVFAGGAGEFGLELADDWTTSRLVQAISGGGLHTSGHSAVLNGPFTGSSEFWVDGGGSLTFNTDSPYTGDLYIREGALRVNATLPGTIRASLETTNPLFVFASVGGTGRVGDLSLRGTLVPGSSTTPHGTFSMSSLSLSGNNTVEFDLGPGGDLLSAENAFAKAIVANAPPDNLNYHSVFTSCTFSFNQLPGVQVGDTYDLVHFGTNGAYIAGTSTIRTITVFSPSDFGYSGLAPGLAGTFELTANALRFHVVPEVVGVCCRGATCDASIDQVSCVGAGTAGASFSIASGTCNSGLSTSTPCCYADFNKVNGISVQDIFDFLNAWFSGSLYAIPGGDGASGTLAVQNIFDFLNAWFAGGC